MKNVLALLLLFATTSIVAQNVNIRNGASFKIGRFEFIDDVLSVNPDGSSTVLLKAGLFGTKYRVLNLNADLNEESKFEIEIPKIENKKVKPFWATQLKESVYFMSRYWDRKSKTYTLFASELDPKNGKFKAHTPVINLTDDKFRSWNNPFSATRSIDSSKVLFLTRYPTKLKENARYNMKVVNSDLSEIWSKDIEFTEEDRWFTMEDILVDKNGNVHFVAGVMMSRDEKKEKDAASRFQKEIYSYYHESGELKHYEVGFQNEIIQSINMSLNDDNELVGTGFYSEKKFWGQGYTGFFYLRIDPNSKKIVASNISPFSEELKAELIGGWRAKRGKDIPKYAVRKVIPLDNGKMGVVAEHYVYTKNTYTDSKGNTHTTESWLYGNTIVMFIDETGKMQTAAVLKKRQYCTAKDGGASLFQKMGIGMTPGVNELPYYGIAVMEVDNNIYILYNENPKNEIRVKDGKNPKSVRQRTAVTNLVTFTPDGKMMTNTLFKAKDRDAGYKMPVMPRSSFQYSNNDMIIFGRKKKNLRVLGLTIN
ncbi:MAG: hypothetical protein WDZ35_02745 [Crocinitomicaceae bacterium]